MKIKNETFKNTLILFLITLVAGMLLGLVYEITSDARNEQIKKTKQEAYKSVFKNASKFEDFNIDTQSLLKTLKENNITEKNAVIETCAYAYDKEDNITGYIITVTAKEGYSGDITFSVGIDLESKITGISILTINETAGLGMNAKEAYFLDQYIDKDGDYFVVNKNESEEGINIDAISGATITTKAMTKGVNAALVTGKYIMTLNSEGGTNE